MSTYRVYFTAVASLSVEVEADDLEDAIEKAYDEMPQTNFHDSPYDLGDWEPDDSYYEVDGEPVKGE